MLLTNPYGERYFKASSTHNKSFEVLKTSPFPFCLDAELDVVFPFQSTWTKRFFWNNIFGREIFQSLLEVIKTNCLTSLNQVHSLPIRISSSMWFPPYPADNHKRFLTNLFAIGREIFQSFIEVITTNRFESSNQVHPLCVRIMSSMVFPCKADEQKHFSN